MGSLKEYFDLYSKEEIEDIYNACKLRIDDLQGNIDNLQCFTDGLSSYLEDSDI